LVSVVTHRSRRFATLHLRFAVTVCLHMRMWTLWPSKAVDWEVEVEVEEVEVEEVEVLAQPPKAVCGTSMVNEARETQC